MRSVSDDTRARAIEVLKEFVALKLRPVAWEECVDALIAAGLLGSGPSNLDRLAGWAVDSGGAFSLNRAEIGGESMFVVRTEDTRYRQTTGIDADPQAAAGAVLARLASEQTDG